MCGIAGIYGSAATQSLQGIATAMADTMVRRGPDSSGVWCDLTHGIALSHRRLAILDLSSAGHQPMQSHDGRYVISFNGEIYNHLDLRSDLMAAGGRRDWRGSSDTETLLEAISHWGLSVALRKLRGMYAFALWDADGRVLTLARDPLGEKPLYFGRVGALFVFASEIKAIQAVPGWTGDIDLDALDHFSRFSYIPAPHSIYRGLHKLEAGSSIAVRAAGAHVSPPEFHGVVRDRPLDSLVWAPLSPAAATQELETRLARSVRERMISDVPLGALFSGGIDSTTIVALMQRASLQPVKTFTVGFGEHEFNEAEHASRLAVFLGTDHHELYVSPKDALALIPSLPAIWDEPFADPSQIPSFLVSKFAREHVTVALAGDGGDELFCGYRHYTLGDSIYRKVGHLPQSLRGVLASALLTASRVPLRPGGAGAQTRERLSRLGHAVGFRTPAAFCHALLAVYDDESLVPGARAIPGPEVRLAHSSLMQQMMELDLQRYLPENIMTKSDRASMGVSLELRAPFLDPDLVDFARSMPVQLKYRDGASKWLLKQVLYRLVPRELVDRRKAGFSVPIGHWLRHELSGWAADLLSADSLRQSAVFDAVRVQQLWQEHREGRRMRQRVLWNVLMFQAWWFEYRGRATGRSTAADIV